MLFYILFGCSPLGTKDLDLSLVDKDGDTFTPEDGDCDDTRADTYPGVAKNDSSELCMRDSDGDGYGDLTPDNPDVTPGQDCNDADPEINPSIEEVPSNGVDQDCDTLELCYHDLDDDGQRSIDASLFIESVDLDCDDTMEGSEEEPATDCNDEDPFTYEGAAPSDGTACMTDADQDGFGDVDPVDGVTAGTDCNDSTDSVYPGAPEVVDDGIDQDCNVLETCYQDMDSDGQRSHDTSLVIESADLDCDDDQEGSTAEPPTDCDDADPLTHVGAAEVDVDGEILCMRDQDEDGFGDADLPSVDEDTANPDLEYDVIYPGTDCDDAVDSIYPEAPEVVDDGVDQDCNAAESCYVDADSDGFRAIDDSLIVESVDDLDCDDDGEGSTAEPATDCNDLDATIYPGATEVVADGIDQNCDTEELCFVDIDSDGFREMSMVQNMVSVDLDCDDTGEGALSEPATDCNDLDSAVYPGADELCNGIAENCDDPNYPLAPDLERDDDFDGFVECFGFDYLTWQGDQSVVDAYLSGYGGGEDCNDANDKTYPGAAYYQSYSQCLTDEDGDGFSPDAAIYAEACYLLVIQDTAGDGWDGYLVLTENDYLGPLFASGLGVGPNGQFADTFYLENGQFEETFYLCSEENLYLEYTADGTMSPSVTSTEDSFQLYHGAVKVYDSGTNISAVIDTVSIERFGPGDVADCDDNNLSHGPYNAYNETEAVYPQCLLDEDADGFAPIYSTESCFVLEMQDSFGDGWNGGAISVIADGVMIDSGLPSGQFSQQSGTFYLENGFANSINFCAVGSNIEFYYDFGDFEFENTYQLYDEQGNLLINDGPGPSTGLVYTKSNGSDCYDEDWMAPGTIDCEAYVDVPAGSFTTGPSNYSLVPMNIEFSHDLVSFVTEIPQAIAVVEDPLLQFTNPLTSGLAGPYAGGAMPDGPEFPAHSISWVQAVEYANYMSEISGLTPCYNLLNNYLIADAFNCNGWRLPTEFEWEYMAKAGQGFLYAGSDDVNEVATDVFEPVGSTIPNAFGLYDMSGSLHEWTNDVFSLTYSSYQSLIGYPDLTDPWLVIIGTDKAIRGGGWDSVDLGYLEELEVEHRLGANLTSVEETIGFRLVRSK